MQTESALQLTSSFRRTQDVNYTADTVCIEEIPLLISAGLYGKYEFMSKSKNIWKGYQNNASQTDGGTDVWCGPGRHQWKQKRWTDLLLQQGKDVLHITVLQVLLGVNLPQWRLVRVFLNIRELNCCVHGCKKKTRSSLRQFLLNSLLQCLVEQPQLIWVRC